jgi:hypothetical protein
MRGERLNVARLASRPMEASPLARLKPCRGHKKEEHADADASKRFKPFGSYRPELILIQEPES